ncbi:uncharacterized protein TEOVI_000386300 [Trypanosoma equiperdum]|uniref:WD domain, G-beta repeat n=1 Tax=Trypanosoma equiperdum TaxID=5694 RepID=A0A1G4IIH3_TRYEQ|nr:hypothetical protein, conserved [Trypanosoma equiperdum]
MWQPRHGHGSQPAPSPCSFTTEGCTVGSSTDVSPRTAEDRFIGVADYKEFLRDPLAVLQHNSKDLTEARYRRTLESCMGLTGTGHMLSHGGDYFRLTRSREGDPDGSFSPAHGIVDSTLTLSSQPFSLTSALISAPSSPPSRGRHPPILQERERCFVDSEGMRQRSETSRMSLTRHSSLMGSPSSTPTRRFGGVMSSNAGFAPAPLMGVLPADHREGCHTPVRPPRESAVTPATVPVRGMGYLHSTTHCSTFSVGSTISVPPMEGPHSPIVHRESRSATPRASSLCGDAHRMTPVTTLRTPVLGPRQSVADPPVLRTPVVHESDLACTPAFSAQMSGFGASVKGSPLLRRGALYSQHPTPRRQVETYEKVLDAHGLPSCDSQGHSNFSPLCWGYAGAVIALQNRVYVWHGPDRTQLIFEAPQTCGVVSAVASSRQATDSGDVYIAYGMENGWIVVSRCPVWGDVAPLPRCGSGEGPGRRGDVMFARAVQVVIRDHTNHVSTLQVVGHTLYAGSMAGTLTLHNLCDWSVEWYTALHLPPGSGSWKPQCVVNVGAPIYRLEVTPDEEHIAVGTNNSLLLYQTSRMGPDDRSKRRTIWANAPHPVRAFCWWGFPFSDFSSVASDGHRGKHGSFFQSVLLYGGGADGSVLSVYSVGSRSEKAAHPLAAPILGIVSSETSDEILISLAPAGSGQNTVVALRQSPANGGHLGTAENDGDGSGFVASGVWDTPDNSSDEEDTRYVTYVDRHHPFGGVGANGGTTNNTTATSGSNYSASNTTASVTPNTVTSRVDGFPPLPTVGQSRAPVKVAELLQMYQLKEDGEVLERLSGYGGLRDGPIYLALSPDNTQLATAGPESMIRMWRAFQTKAPSHADPCQFR